MATPLVDIPKTPQAAPLTINLPKNVFDTAMKGMWEDSYYTEEGMHQEGTKPPILSKVHECGYTVFEDTTNQELEVGRGRCGGTDNFGTTQSDLELPDSKSPAFPDFRKKARGMMHSHPARDRKSVVSLDATDAAWFLKFQLNFQLIVTAQGTVFLYLRTEATREGVKDPVDGKWVEKNFADGKAKLQNVHDSEKWRNLSEKLAIEVAQHYKLAFYKGSNLMLKRVWPEPNEKIDHDRTRKHR